MAIKYAILVDWNNDGDFSDTHDDITGDTLSMSWSRGRDYASALEGKSVAGKLSATLVNTNGKYSPSSVYFFHLIYLLYSLSSIFSRVLFISSTSF